MWAVYPPFTFIVAQKCSKLRGVSMLKEHDEEILIEFKRTRELTKYLPHTIQEEEKYRWLPLLLTITIRWLCTALLEWVASLREKREMIREKGKDSWILERFHILLRFHTGAMKLLLNET